MFYNNTAITPDLKLMPFSVTLSEDKVGYIEDIELASIVPEGQDTIDLEYLPDIADYGIIKITPEIKAPVKKEISKEIDSKKVGVAESDPLKDKIGENVNMPVIYSGRLGKLVLLPNAEFGIEIVINDDITTLQLTLDALEANLLVEKSEFGNTDTIDELNKNIERISAAIKSSKGVTQIFPVQINGKTVSNGLLKLADAGISLVIKTESIGQVSTINGEIVDVSFSNKEETIASINGIRYDIIRDKSGSITALTYMSNSKEISLLDDEINKINKNIDTLRNTISDIEKDTENLSSKPSRKIDPIIIRISELQELKDSNLKKRTNLVQTNKKIYVYGENSNNYIFALNRLPNSFQRLTKNATKANEKEDLKSITNLSVSRGIAENITEILSYQYPEALDKLFSGDVESLTTKDLLNIELWLEDSIAKLNELGYSVINRGDLVDDILNQINALNEFRNDLQLIKLTKNGKIYNYKQVGKFFSESKVQERSSVPQNEGSRPESTKRVLGQSTKEDFAELIKRAREQNVDDVFDNTEETSTKNTSEQTDFEIINNSTLNNIEDNFQKEFLRMQKEGLNAKSLHEAYKKRLEELKTIVSLQNVSVSEYLIGNKPIFSNKSEEIVQVIKKTNDTVTVKNILTQETKEFTEAELITNFDKTTMEATQPKPEVTLTDADIQDSKESKNNIDDLIKNQQEKIAQSQAQAKASDAKSRWNKLGENSTLC
jgi:hypothetical protein